MEQGKKLLPEILANPTAEGSAKVLSKVGVDKAFLNSAFDRYGGFASKLGLNKGAVKNALDGIERAMDSTKHGTPSISAPRKAKFDSSKYPILK